MDLFTPIVDQEKLHPSFQSIACERNRYALDVLQDWARGFQDRDSKFVKEFQTSFEPAFWELYLHAILKHFQLAVDFQHNRPDFVVTSPYEFSMEATVALNDTRTTPIHRQTAEDIPDDLNKFNEEAIVRLSNSFSSKLEKYRNSYSSLGHVRDKPFVLALAPFDRPFANLQAQRTIEALLFGYYVDEEAYIKEGDYSEQPKDQIIERVLKHNGAPVTVGLFNSDVAKEISAVVFNPTATWGKALALSQDPASHSVFTAVSLNVSGSIPHKITLPKASYMEHLIDGLRVYHNPHASYPLPTDIFRNYRVFQTYWDHKEGDWVYEQNDGQLLFRNVQTLIKQC
ncbi:MAG TPA: hypothetical protein PKI41_14630 [Candidatus Competibacteraceae bacterium]|nr:hypothetical protein [Candidatus Competibacteraceae bacterium]